MPKNLAALVIPVITGRVELESQIEYARKNAAQETRLYTAIVSAIAGVLAGMFSRHKRWGVQNHPVVNIVAGVMVTTMMYFFTSRNVLYMSDKQLREAIRHAEVYKLAGLSVSDIQRDINNNQNHHQSMSHVRMNKYLLVASFLIILTMSAFFLRLSLGPFSR